MFQISKNQTYLYIIGFLMCGYGLLLPVSVHAQNLQSDEQYRAVLLELVRTLQSQIQLLQQQLADQRMIDTSPDLIAVDRPAPVFTGAPVIQSYDISTESGRRAIVNVDHHRYLNRIYEIFPDAYEAKLSEFSLFQDPEGVFGAYIETIPPDHTQWSFAVNLDMLEKENTPLGTELIVHELAHVISYESIAGVPLPGSAACHTYFKARGCPKDNSYLAAFVDEFWTPSGLLRAFNFRNSDNAVTLAEDYYDRNEDEYVSGYAALSPEEDFAESFAQYVVARQSSTDTTASEKVRWFEQFAELRDIRQSVVLEN